MELKSHLSDKVAFLLMPWERFPGWGEIGQNGLSDRHKRVEIINQ